MSRYYKKKIGYDDTIAEMKILFNNGIYYSNNYINRHFCYNGCI